MLIYERYERWGTRFLVSILSERYSRCRDDTFASVKYLQYICVYKQQPYTTHAGQINKIMRITQVRDDGKVNTLRTLRIEQLVELMKGKRLGDAIFSILIFPFSFAS